MNKTKIGTYMKNIALILYVIMFTCMNVNAKEVTPQIQPIVINMPNDASQSYDEVTLKEQNKMIKQYHSSLLDTVYWGLAAVFTLAIFLTGSSWFTNFKISEKDQKRLTEDFNSRIDQILIQFDSKIVERQTTLLGDFDKKLDTSTLKINSDIDTIRTQLNSNIQYTTTQFDELKQQNTKMLDRISNLRTKIALANSEIRHIEEYIWEIKGIPSNVLITQGQALGYAIAAEEKDEVEAILRRITETIEREFLSKSKTIDKQCHDILNSYLDHAEISHPDSVTKVKSLIGRVFKTEL